MGKVRWTPVRVADPRVEAPVPPLIGGAVGSSTYVRPMRDQWFTVGVPATVAVVVALYTTGGRAALARRAIKQDLEIASGLPAGTARRALERIAEDKAVLYASRWVGPQAPGLRLHLVLGAVAAVGVTVTSVASWLGDAAGSNPVLSAVSLLLLLLGLSSTVAAIATWAGLMFMADNARTRQESVESGRERVQRQLDSPSSRESLPRPAGSSRSQPRRVERRDR